MRPATVVALGLPGDSGGPGGRGPATLAGGGRGPEGRSGGGVHRHRAGGGPADARLAARGVLLRRGGRRPQRQTVQSLGSGVIIDPGGTIVTNDHVIRGASAVHVMLADGRQLDAEVVGADAQNDLAVLRVASKTPLPAAKLGTSSDLMIGETVVAIGSPFGLTKTVTSGVLSAVGRSFKANDQLYIDFLQTDAAINPGNSRRTAVEPRRRGDRHQHRDLQRRPGHRLRHPGGQGAAHRPGAEELREGQARVGWHQRDGPDATARAEAGLGADRRRGGGIGGRREPRGGGRHPARGRRGRAGRYARCRTRTSSRPGSAATRPGLPMPLVLWRDGHRMSVTVTPGRVPGGAGGCATPGTGSACGLRPPAARWRCRPCARRVRPRPSASTAAISSSG